MGLHESTEKGASSLSYYQQFEQILSRHLQQLFKNLNLHSTKIKLNVDTFNEKLWKEFNVIFEQKIENNEVEISEPENQEFRDPKENALLKLLYSYCDQFNSHKAKLDIIFKIIEKGLRNRKLKFDTMINTEAEGNWDDVFSVKKPIIWCKMCDLLNDNLDLVYYKDCNTLLRKLRLCLERSDTVAVVDKLIMKLFESGNFVPLYTLLAEGIDYIKDNQMAYYFRPWKIQNRFDNLFERFRYLSSIVSFDAKFEFIPYTSTAQLKHWEIDVNGLRQVSSNLAHLPCDKKTNRRAEEQFLYRMLGQYRSDDHLNKIMMVKYDNQLNSEVIHLVMVKHIVRLVQQDEKSKTEVVPEKKAYEMEVQWKIIADQLCSWAITNMLDLKFLLNEINKLYEERENKTLQSNRIVWLIVIVVVSEKIRSVFEKNFNITVDAINLLNGQPPKTKRAKIEQNEEDENSIFDTSFNFYKETVNLEDLSTNVEDYAMGCLLRRLQPIYNDHYSIFQSRYPCVNSSSLENQQLTNGKFADWFKSTTQNDIFSDFDWKKIYVLSFCPATENLTKLLYQKVSSAGPGGLLAFGVRYNGSADALSIKHLEMLSIYILIKLLYQYLNDYFKQTNYDVNTFFSPGALETFSRMHFLVPYSLNATLPGAECYNLEFINSIKTSLRFIKTLSNLRIVYMFLELLSTRLIRHFRKLREIIHAKLFKVKLQQPMLQNRQIYSQYESLVLKYLYNYDMPFKFFFLIAQTVVENHKNVWIRRFVIYHGINMLATGSTLFSIDVLKQKLKDKQIHYNKDSDNTTNINPVQTKSNHLVNLLIQEDNIFFSKSVAKRFPMYFKLFYEQEELTWSPLINQKEPANELSKSYPPGKNPNELLYLTQNAQPHEQDCKLLISHYQHPDRCHLFLCVLWTLNEKISSMGTSCSVAFANAKKVLQAMDHDQMPHLIKVFIDFLIESIYCKVVPLQNQKLPKYPINIELLNKQVAPRAASLDKFIWELQLFSFNDIFLALTCGDVDESRSIICHRLVESLLFKCPGFRTRYEFFEQLDLNPKLEEDKGDWSKKLSQFQAKFPEFFNYEKMARNTGGNTVPSEPIPVYYDNVLIRSLTAFDILLHRLIDYNEFPLLSLILKKYKKLFSYHPFLGRFISRTFSYYYSHENFSTEIKLKFLTLIDLPTRTRIADIIPLIETCVPQDRNKTFLSYIKSEFLELAFHLATDGIKPEQRFNEYRNNQEQCLQEYVIELMVMPFTASELSSILLDVVLTPSKVVPNQSECSVVDLINTLVQIYILLPVEFRTELFLRLIEVIFELGNNDFDEFGFPLKNPFFKFTPISKKTGFDISSPNLYLAIVQALLLQAPAILNFDLPTFLQFLLNCEDENGLPKIKSFEQILFLCHVVGPFMDCMDEIDDSHDKDRKQQNKHERERHAAGKIAISIIEMLKLVSDNIKGDIPTTPVTDCVIDFLYHLKYKYPMGGNVHQTIAYLVPQLHQELQDRLKFFPKLNRYQS